MRIKKSPFGYIVLLTADEDVIDQIITFARDVELPGAFITGIGSIKDVTLGVYRLSEDDFLTRAVTGPLELTNFTGNIGYLDENPLLHAHVTAFDHQFACHGGHLLFARVHLMVELAVFSDTSRIFREPSPGKTYSTMAGKDFFIR